METTILLCLGAAALLVALFFRWKNARCRRCDSFWLSNDGQSDGAGPFTAAQIVAMWRLGQITTRGVIMAEGESEWMPLMQFARRFDVSLAEDETRSYGRRNAIALLVLVLVLIAVMVGVGERESGSRRRAVQGQSLGQQLRDFQNSPRGQEIKAEALAEYRQEQAEKKAADEKIGRALQMASGGFTAPSAPSSTSPGLPPSLLGN